MPESAPSSPIPSPPRQSSLGSRHVAPASLPQWSASSAARIAVRARPGMSLDARTLRAVSAACSELVVATASLALAAKPTGGASELEDVERAVCSLLWRPRAAGGIPPHDSLVRRSHAQAREMATNCSGAAALQPEVTGMLVDAARRDLLAGGKRCCDGCSEQAIAYLGAIADFMCSEMLAATLAQAEQECARQVLPSHLNAALLADRQLVEGWPRCFGSLEVCRTAVPFCCARFGSYGSESLPLRDCPMVVFDDSERLGEGLFGAVAVVELSESPNCSFASRAQAAQAAGAIALILICDNALFEPTCRESESAGLTIPVAIVAACDRALFDDERTISLSLNAHGLAMYSQSPSTTAARDGDAAAAEGLAAQAATAGASLMASASLPRISPETRNPAPDSGGRRSAKRAAHLPAVQQSSGSSGRSELLAAAGVDISEVLARLCPDGGAKRSKSEHALSRIGGRGESSFALPSLVPS